MQRCGSWLLLMLMLGLLPQWAGASPLLSEVFYDASGSDDGQSFVELWGTPGLDLDGFTIEGVNGSNGGVTVTLALTGGINGSGLFLVADLRSDGTTDVSGADLLLNFDLQNGPDSVVLRDPGGAIVDALGYGAFDMGEIFAGEGTAAPDAPADSSLARVFANVDTDDNAFDFAVAAPTPGAAEFAVPEPNTAALLGVGLTALAIRRRGPANPPR
jgi:hypothetical protein